MVDYLEEHLGEAEVLLKRVRQMELSASGLLLGANLKKKVNDIARFAEKRTDLEEKNEIVFKNKIGVYNPDAQVDQNKSMVYKSDSDPELPEILEKRQDTVVNRQIESDDDSQNPERGETNSGDVENRARLNAERAENRVPLSAQLEELDQAVSALTALIPDRQEATQGSYPLALSRPQDLTAGSDITGVPNGAWSGVGAAARADSAYGGAQSWAEQADRMFRRDSRRYDGGFYLY